MNLYGKILFCINQFDQKRETFQRLAFPAPFFLPDPIQILGKKQPLMTPGSHNALPFLMGGQLPAFRNGFIVTFLSINIPKPGASP